MTALGGGMRPGAKAGSWGRPAPPRPLPPDRGLLRRRSSSGGDQEPRCAPAPQPHTSARSTSASPIARAAMAEPVPARLCWSRLDALPPDVLHAIVRLLPRDGRKALRLVQRRARELVNSMVAVAEISRRDVIDKLALHRTFPNLAELRITSYGAEHLSDVRFAGVCHLRAQAAHQPHVPGPLGVQQARRADAVRPRRQRPAAAGA